MSAARPRHSYLNAAKCALTNWQPLMYLNYGVLTYATDIDHYEFDIRSANQEEVIKNIRNFNRFEIYFILAVSTERSTQFEPMLLIVEYFTR